MGARMNRLRAGVLGANDGIVSTAALVVGVAGAGTDRSALLTAGIAGLFSGALSMAVGEYVSVSSQRDAERAALATERRELTEMPEAEFEELTRLLQGKGLSPRLSRQVARELTERDALTAHAEIELGIDPENLTNPWHAAAASFAAFTVGALLPLIAIVLPPPAFRVAVTVAAVTLALVVTGWSSARMGGAPAGTAIMRVVSGGLIAMAVTYGVGSLVGFAGV